MFARYLLIAGFVAVSMPWAARAEEAVKIGNAYALLNKPASAQVGLILIPGGDGVMNIKADGTFSSGKNNQLVRTRQAYLAHGIATLTIDVDVDVPSAVNYMRKVAPVVVVAGTSRGSLRVPNSLPAKPNAIVLTAAMLNDVRSSVGSSSALPPTLLVHHRKDACRVTLPQAVEPFKTWAGNKVQVVWLQGGISAGNDCGAQAYHGFNGLDGQVVSAIAQFVKSVK